MGKKGERLLRLLRSTKKQNEEVKKNPSNLQHKRTAQPNDYFKSGSKGDLEMGSDAMPHKIQLDCVIQEEIEISPAATVATNGPVIMGCTQNTKSSTVANNKLHPKFTNGKKAPDVANAISQSKSEYRKSRGEFLNAVSISVEIPATATHHTATKRHPLNPNDSCIAHSSQAMTNTNSCGREFQTKKPRSESDDESTRDAIQQRFTKVPFFKSESPCSSSSTTFAQGCNRQHGFGIPLPEQVSSSSHFQNHRSSHECSIGEVFGKVHPGRHLGQPPYRAQKHHPSHYQRRPHPTYMNDERYTEEFTVNTYPRLAFTVTDKEGKGIELTIAVYGASSSHHQRENPSRNNNNSNSNGTTAFASQPRRCGNTSNGVSYENFTSDSNRTLDIQSVCPFVAMSPNPEAMSSIRPTNGISYHIEENQKTFEKPVLSTCIGATRACNFPKESYKLTEESIIKLKSFCGQMGPDPVKTVFSSYDDVRKLNNLAKILERVEECPWYWGNLSGQDSKKVLAGTEPGTFLLRLSSDPKYLFSLSVKTRFGPTSIRIVHENGYFRFDSELNEAQRQARSVPTKADSTARKGHPNYVHRTTKKFTCVVHLVLYYTKHLLEANQETDSSDDKTTLPIENMSCLNREDRPGELFMCYWETRSGRREIPVLLSTPLPKKKFFPSLQTLCRTAMSKEYKLWKPDHQQSIERKDLPTSLRRFIKQYPYPI